MKFIAFIFTETPEEPTIVVNDILTTTKLNEAENDETTTMDLLTEPTTVTAGNHTRSTTTEGGPDLITTNQMQPGGGRGISNNIIHIAVAVGIGVTALLALVVSCVCVACITKHIQARSTKGKKSDAEQPQIVSSNSNGILLQDNTAYRESTASNTWDIVGYEIMSIEDKRRSDTERAQNSSNSNEIVVQQNTAYKKSTNNGDIVGYETIPNEDQRRSDTNQAQNSSHSTSGIVVQQNTAYKKSTNNGALTRYETMVEMAEQVMRLNQAYGLQGESYYDRMVSLNAGDYDRLTGNIPYAHNQMRRDLEKILNSAVPVTHELQSQQQETNPEDNEHPYDYIT